MINFSIYQSTKFFLSNYNCLRRLIPNFNTYNKLNDEGQKRIDKAMDIVYII